MSLSLSNLKPATGSRKKRKRVGRGNASGHGTYSTRGLKGQKARSGVSGLKRLGMKKQLLSIPKSRGFKSYHAKAQVVTLADLNRTFEDGATINPRLLLRKSLIKTLRNDVKILAQGKLTIKNITVTGISLSAGAKEQIEKTGGTITA